MKPEIGWQITREKHETLQICLVFVERVREQRVVYGCWFNNEDSGYRENNNLLLLPNHLECFQIAPDLGGKTKEKLLLSEIQIIGYLLKMEILYFHIDWNYQKFMYV